MIWIWVCEITRIGRENVCGVVGWCVRWVEWGMVSCGIVVTPIRRYSTGLADITAGKFKIEISHHSNAPSVTTTQ